MMEVEYELTLEDISAFHAHYRRHPPASRRRLDPVAGIVMLVVCALGCLAFAAAIALHLDSAALLLIGASIGVCTGSLFNGWHLRRMMAPRRLLESRKDAEKVLGWGRVMLDAQGIHVASKFSSCLYRWNGINKVATTDEYIFFYITTINAFIVPLRAFADGRAFDSFADAARRYHDMGAVGEAWERRGETGIQIPADPGAAKRVEEILPNNQLPAETELRP